MEGIKTHFRKKLEPISKQDVTTLINLPNDDHLEKLEQEHKEMLMAHKKVFQNVVMLKGASNSSKEAKKVKAKQKEKIKTTPEVKPAVLPITAAEQGTKTGKTISRVERNKKPSPVAVEADRKGNATSTNRKLESLAVAIKKSNSGEDEVYSIIKEHLEYEMTGGAPKFRSRQQTSKIAKTQRTSSGTSLLRSDVAGRALLKYDESHKKLQKLVDSFKEKVGPVPVSGPSPKVKTSHAARSSSSSNATTAPDVSDDEINDLSHLTHKKSPPVPLLATQEVLKERKKMSRKVTLTLSSSMKTIDQASSVAQRLGTLMSRVALRNEAYDYERQQEAEGEKKSVSTFTTSADNYDDVKVDNNNNNFPTTSVKSNSVNLSTNHLNASNSFLTNNGPTILPKSRQTSKLSLQQPLRNNSISRHSVPPGVTKLDSSHFDKYVEEMKKVAQKAAESFEKFKETQVHNESELLSFSEGEDEQEDSEAAALVADYSRRSANTKVSVPQTSHLLKQQSKVSSVSKLKSPEKVEMGTSPRQNATVNSLINIKPRTSARDTGNNNLNAANGFLKNNDPAIIPKSRQTSKLSLQQQPLRNNSIGRFNVSPGVTKLDSLSTTTKVPVPPTILSQHQNKVPSVLRQKQSSLEKMEMGTETTPRKNASANGLINSKARTSVRDISNNKNKNDSPPGFEFAPGMSYTDQLMLQKLRKLKEQEGWGTEFKLPEIMEGGTDKLLFGDRPGDVPHTEKDMQALLNHVKSLEVPKVEQPGIGALSLNAILRARMGK